MIIAFEHASMIGYQMFYLTKIIFAAYEHQHQHETHSNY